VQRHRDVFRAESSTLELNQVAMTTVPVVPDTVVPDTVVPDTVVPDTVLRATVSVFPAELAAPRLTLLLVCVCGCRRTP